MKELIQQRNARLFKKLLENQGIAIKELDVAKMTAWQALEEEELEEETLEETQGVVIDPETTDTDDDEEEEELSDEEVEELTKDAGI